MRRKQHLAPLLKASKVLFFGVLWMPRWVMAYGVILRLWNIDHATCPNCTSCVLQNVSQWTHDVYACFTTVPGNAYLKSCKMQGLLLSMHAFLCLNDAICPLHIAFFLHTYSVNVILWGSSSPFMKDHNVGHTHTCQGDERFYLVLAK